MVHKSAVIFFSLIDKQYIRVHISKSSYCMLKEVNTQFIFEEGVSEGLSFVIFEETMLWLKYVKFFHMNITE